MKYSVEVPQWSDGAALLCTGIEAANPDEAVQKVVDWVNRRAGYHYCDQLPVGTRVFNEAGHLLDWPNVTPDVIVETLLRKESV